MTSAVRNEWYAVRVDYRRELAVKEYLDSRAVENFLPMQYKVVGAGRQKVRKLLPLVHNLIFIHSTKSVIDEIKTTTTFPIRYLMFRQGAQSSPIVVPDEQMRNFIRVAGTYDDQLIFISQEEVPMEKGDRVRILSGPFAGVEGIYVRLKGSRSRRVVVQIPGIMSIATATVLPSMVEPI